MTEGGEGETWCSICGLPCLFRMVMRLNSIPTDTWSDVYQPEHQVLYITSPHDHIAVFVVQLLSSDRFSWRQGCLDYHLVAEEKSKDCLGHCGGGKVTRTPILHHLLLSQSAIVNIISVLFSDLLHITHCRSRYACNKSTFKVSKLTKPCGVHYTSTHQLFFHHYTIEKNKFHRKGE